MTAEIKIPHVRQRINISQTAKGLHQIDVTVEQVSETPDMPEVMAQRALDLVKATEKALTEDKRKLVTEVE